MRNGDARLLIENTQAPKALRPCALVPLRVMPYHLWIIAFVVQLMVSTVALWLAMRLTKEEGPFLGLLAAALIASLVGLLPIPYVGWLLSFVVLLVLISKWTTAEIWPDAVLIVVVAWALAQLASFALRMAFR